MNPLVTKLSGYPETFRDCRNYLFYRFDKSKDKVLQLENMAVDLVIPYYLYYLESKGIDLLDAINLCRVTTGVNQPYWVQQQHTIVLCFSKLEIKDTNFMPF